MVEGFQGPFVPNYFQIGPVVFDKKIFKVFLFSCHGNQNSAWNGNILATLKGDHRRIIPVQFGEILPDCLGDVILRKLLMDDGRTCMTNNGHPMITIAHLEPMAQVS